MMKTSVTILLLAALLGLCETLPVEGGGCPAVNPKPGRCPKITPGPCFARYLKECETDEECPRDKKCCYLLCGYRCTDPQTDTFLCKIVTYPGVFPGIGNSSLNPIRQVQVAQ